MDSEAPFIDPPKQQPSFSPPQPGQSIMPSSRRGNHIVRHNFAEPVIPQTTRVAVPVTPNPTPEQAHQAAAIASAAFQPSVAPPPQAAAFNPEEQPSTAMPSIVGNGGRRKKSTIVLLVILAVFIIFGGAGAALYYTAITDPSNILKMTLANEVSGKATTQKYDGNALVGAVGSSTALSATFKGAGSRTGAGSFSGVLSFAGKQVSLDAGTTDGKAVYVRGSGLEYVPILTLGLTPQSPVPQQLLAAKLGAAFATLDKTWFQLDPTTINSLASLYPTQPVSTNYTASEIKIIELTYLKYPFLHVAQTLPEQAVGGVESYHYRTVIDKPELAAFVLTIKNAKLAHINLADNQVTSLQNSIKNVDTTAWPIDVWISKSSKLFTKIAVSKKTTTPADAISLVVNLHDFNAPVTITQPTPVQPLAPALGKILSGGATAAH